MFSRQLREQLIRKANCRCELCGRESSNLEITHIRPISKGGGDAPDNLRVLCRSCHVLVDQGLLQGEDLRTSAVTGYELERVVADAFHAMGFSVLTEATGRDAGVDLIAQKPVHGSDRPLSFVVQCKWSKRRLGTREVSDFASKATSFGNRLGILVSSSGFTRQARELAERFGVRLLGPDELHQFLQETGTEE